MKWEEEDGRRIEQGGQVPGHRGPYGAWEGLLTSFCDSDIMGGF